jgi:hypothetical protein
VIEASTAPARVPTGVRWHRLWMRFRRLPPVTAAFETALIVLGVVALLVLLPHHVDKDGYDRYQALSALLGHGRILDTKYSLIGPLFSAPLWYAGRALGLPYDGVGLYNWLVFAVGLASLYALLKDRMDRRTLRAFLLLLIAGSMFPNHLTNYFGEVFTAMTVGVGLIAAQVGRPRLGWTAVALGVANTPAALPALVLVVLVRIVQTHRLRYSLVVVLALALIGAENWMRRGSPLATNYENGFTEPFLIGLLSILFSFGKGLLFFAPGLLLPLRRVLADWASGPGVRSTPLRTSQEERESSEERTRRLLGTTHLLWMVFLGGLVLVYARWWAWYGGWFWGPRFFLIAGLPACLALALRLRPAGRSSLLGDLATLGALALSVWVGINGAVYDQNTLFDICHRDHYAYEFYCHYLPGYSVLWRPFTVPDPIDWHGVLFIAYAAVVFAYLAAPVMRRIAVDLYGRLRLLVPVTGSASAGSAAPRH